MTLITPVKTDYVMFDPPTLGHLGMIPEVVVPPPRDERIWVLLEPNVWFRPLFFDMNHGSHGEVLKVKRGGVLSKHRHPTPVHGYVISGSWRYLEHTWRATEGSYVMEPPGEVHTLTCDSGEEMQTVFFIQGPTLYVDDEDRVTLVEDNFQLIQACRDHYEKTGLGADFVNQFIR
jgi:2,4'-dihydroxyacetophenone dioxygenase